MPNVIGGKSYKKNKSGNARRKSKNPDVPVDTTTGIDHYGIVQKRLGTNRLLVKIDNGNEVQAVIPGKFYKKVWFKAGDYIHIQNAGNDSYDVKQKIVNQIEQNNAQIALGKRETGESDIFRPNMTIEDEDEFDLNESNESESEDEDFDAFGNKINKPKAKPKEESSDKEEKELVVNKQNISADKLKRKQNEKNRDVARRNNRDNDEYFKPDSIVEKSEEESESEESESE